MKQNKEDLNLTRNFDLLTGHLCILVSTFEVHFLICYVRQKQKQNKKKITKTKQNKNIKQNMWLGSNLSRPDIDLSLFHVRQFYVLSHQGGGGCKTDQSQNTVYIVHESIELRIISHYNAKIPHPYSFGKSNQSYL